MATLFERVSGIDENKIPIHLIRSCLSEINAGRMTVADSVLIMDLNEPQTTDLTNVLTSAATSSNSSLFSSRVFAYLILAEMNVSGYENEAAFWAMIAEEGAK